MSHIHARIAFGFLQKPVVPSVECVFPSVLLYVPCDFVGELQARPFPGGRWSCLIAG